MSSQYVHPLHSYGCHFSISILFHVFMSSICISASFVFNTCIPSTLTPHSYSKLASWFGMSASLLFFIRISSISILFHILMSFICISASFVFYTCIPSILTHTYLAFLCGIAILSLYRGHLYGGRSSDDTPDSSVSKRCSCRVFVLRAFVLWKIKWWQRDGLVECLYGVHLYCGVFCICIVASFLLDKCISLSWIDLPFLSLSCYLIFHFYPSIHIDVHVQMRMFLSLTFMSRYSCICFSLSLSLIDLYLTFYIHLHIPMHAYYSYACMHTRMHACMHVCMHVCMHECRRIEGGIRIDRGW